MRFFYLLTPDTNSII